VVSPVCSLENLPYTPLTTARITENTLSERWERPPRSCYLSNFAKTGRPARLCVSWITAVNSWLSDTTALKIIKKPRTSSRVEL
jgi:hypothetical protein